VSPDARSWKPADAEPKAAAQGSKGPKQKKTPAEHIGIIWLRQGEFVRPLEVKALTSDGINTAIAAVTLRDGQEVVTGETVETAQSGTQNPFVPPVRRR
jgi:hypothetical protein